jgi:hypothetical protein
MKKAAIYVRVSTPDQHVESQLYDLREFAAQRGFEVVHEYEDRGVCGQKARRPGLDALMADARRKKFSVVLVAANPFGGGGLTALVDIDYIEPQFGAYITAHPEITPDSLPIFMTDDTYLTGGSPILNNCCIGGYHSANGPQAYSHFTFIRVPGDFSQDVAALSHEVGEWMDDPGVKGAFNPVACGILEVGDPEEGFTNYGDFRYPLSGFTY